MSEPALDMAYDHDESRTRFVFVEGGRQGQPYPLYSLDDLEADE